MVFLHSIIVYVSLINTVMFLYSVGCGYLFISPQKIVCPPVDSWGSVSIISFFLSLSLTHTQRETHTYRSWIRSALFELVKSLRGWRKLTDRKQKNIGHLKWNRVSIVYVCMCMCVCVFVCVVHAQHTFITVMLLLKYRFITEVRVSVRRSLHISE